MNSYIKIGIWVLMLITLCACGGSSPENAYNRIADDASKGNWDKVYDSFSAKSQGQVDMALKMLAGLASSRFEEGDPEAERLQNMSGKELYVDMLTDKNAPNSLSEFGEVISKQIDGDYATLLVCKDGGEENIQMVKENDEWKLHFKMK